MRFEIFDFDWIVFNSQTNKKLPDIEIELQEISNFMMEIIFFVKWVNRIKYNFTAINNSIFVDIL